MIYSVDSATVEKKSIDEKVMKTGKYCMKNFLWPFIFALLQNVKFKPCT